MRIIHSLEETILHRSSNRQLQIIHTMIPRDRPIQNVGSSIHQRTLDHRTQGHQFRNGTVTQRARLRQIVLHTIFHRNRRIRSNHQISHILNRKQAIRALQAVGMMGTMQKIMNHQLTNQRLQALVSWLHSKQCLALTANQSNEFVHRSLHSTELCMHKCLFCHRTCGMHIFIIYVANSMAHPYEYVIYIYYNFLSFKHLLLQLQ